MSGHSKWAGIKHKKAIVDAKRGKEFTRVVREIQVAAREGGSDPQGNFRLRLALQKAREVNMPNDKVDNAIKRGTGELKGGELEEFRLEGYGPHGVAVMVDCVSDNRNRTVADVRHFFSRSGGNLGETGSVAWMFTKKGLLSVEPGKRDREELALELIEAGAADVQVEEDLLEVETDPAEFEAVRARVEGMGVKLASAEVTMSPTTTVPLDESQAGQVLRLLDSLEEHDDIQEVFANFDIPTDILEKISAAVG
ncbi:MAG: YebC/PmpR family DNA-binding transcriptional regulator [Candidatus Dormibacteria bacterium]